MLKRIGRLALPNIVSNITVPLLSLVDMGLAGRMGAASSIGAVVVAVGILNFVYWLFACLRMGTTGFTAQAYGRRDDDAIRAQLRQGVILALLLSVFILLLRPWLYGVGYLLSAGMEGIGTDARVYLAIAFWGAPAALSLYVLNGWFIGMQNTRIPMVVAIFGNVVNIGLSIYLAGSCRMGVAGLALGTVTAQYASVAVLLLAVRVRYPGMSCLPRGYRWLIDLAPYAAYLKLGLQLFVRTALLGGITLFFTYAGARFGALTMAANALLMQLFTLFSYFLDGFAYAGEALTGRYIGERSPGHLLSVRRNLFALGTGISIFTSLLYFFAADNIVGLLTNDASVRQEAARYVVWVALIPVTSFLSFLWDGLFVGATAPREMLFSMSAGALVFFIVYFIVVPLSGPAGLWLAFILYLCARSAVSRLLGHRLISNLCTTLV